MTGSERSGHVDQHVTEAGAADGIFDRILPEGSVRAGVFNIASATLGAGALTLPYALKESGIALGLGWLALGMLATVYSIKLLIIVMQAVKFSPAWKGPRNLDSYEELTLHLFGKRVEYFVEIQIIVFCYGTAIAYIIAVGDILEPVRKLDAMPDFLQEKYGKQLVMCVFWLLMMLPLSLLKNVNALRFSSLLGVMSILVLVAATVYHCIDHRLSNWDYDCNVTGSSDGVFDVPPPVAPPQDEDCDKSVDWVVTSYKTLLPVPLIMLAYTCQVNVFAIYQELKNPSPQKMMRISWMGMGGICFLVYALMGTFGYIDFLDNTESTILHNLDPSKDAVIAVAFIGIAMTVVVAFPLLVFPCRDSIFQVMLSMRSADEMRSLAGDSVNDRHDVASSSSRGFLWGHAATRSVLSMHKTSVKPSDFTHYALSFSISLSALLFALVIPKMSTIFSYLGAVCSSYLCFHLPAAFIKKMKAIEQEYFSEENGPSRYQLEHDGESCRPKLRNLWTEPKIPNDILSVIGVEILYYGGIVAGIASIVVTAVSS
eukprot:TRINITY_DN37411_c0_g1_i1.p1 TRINITY_DN37411_c0_g1~~TRINITY_DN37411_c0_g1_i1.p1  ORF type:complete len:542 (+),score=221.83 TRINITY_DN37411_c0_g1_i1:257-1882(+)